MFLNLAHITFEYDPKEEVVIITKVPAEIFKMPLEEAEKTAHLIKAEVVAKMPLPHEEAKVLFKELKKARHLLPDLI